MKISRLETFSDFLKDIFFTRRCVACGDLIPFGRDCFICEECEKDLTDYSDRDFYILGFDMKACYEYRDAARKAVISFKYRNNRDAGVFFARKIASVAESTFGSRLNGMTVISVPSAGNHPERRYNQSEVLAKKVAEYTGMKFEQDVLRKKKSVKSQVKCRSYAERRENIRKAIRVRDKKSVIGKRYLLIDDTLTTGATVSECARVLKDAGALSVNIICALKTNILLRRPIIKNEENIMPKHVYHRNLYVNKQLF